MRRLFTLDSYLAMAYGAGATMAILAQALGMPDKRFQIIGTLIMFIACSIWTAEP